MILMSKSVCYNRDMAYIPEKKSEQVLVNITPTTHEMLKQVVTIEGRPMGYVVRELMIRGLDAYIEDGSLRGPLADAGREAAKRAIAEGIRMAIPESIGQGRPLAPVVATIGGRETMPKAEIARTINDDELSEIQTRMTSGRKKIPVLKEKAG